MAINYWDKSSQVYELDLVISEDHVREEFNDRGYTEIIHSAIPLAIGDHLSQQSSGYVEAFGIENVSRVLTEGYEFSNGTVAEDFAITSSYNGGELVIGQVVSSNGKQDYGETSFDVIQAENFERQLKSDRSIDSAIKSVYTVRTCLDPEEVKDKETEIRNDLEQGLTHPLDIEVIELGRGEEIKWNQVMSTLDKC